MALHLIKLCVGIDSVGELIAYRAALANAPPRLEARHVHVTRMMPKRAEELLAGGSLYWVIAGQVAARQRLVEVEPFTDADGVGRCKLWMDPEVVKVVPRPYRAFQGWRYLQPDDAPPDLARAGEGLATMPDAMRAELGALGLL